MSAPPSYLFTILAVGIGNALEWYDFAIFGALADVFGEHFFPATSSGAQLMSAFSVYCSAFFMRPFGGLLFGYIGDVHGRKKALEISIGLMILSSVLMGLLPTYEMIGYKATALIVILRMLQGVAVGGEMVGAYIYTVEGCPDRWVAFWSGICKSTGLFGTVLGMGFVSLLREVMHYKHFYSWGWRIPFLTSIIMGGLGAIMRSFLKESQEYVHSKGNSQSDTKLTIREAVSFHWPEIIIVALIVSFWATGFYTSFIWMAYFTSELISGDNPVPHAWLINTIMMSVFVLLIPCAGLCADIASNQNFDSYKRIMKLGASIIVLFACPVFYIINMKETWSVCLGYFILSLGLSLYACCLPLVMVRHFTVKFRYISMGIAYNVANAIFAGTAPLIQTALVLHVHTPSTFVNLVVIPALLLIAVGLVSVGSLVWGSDACRFFRKRFNMNEWSIGHDISVKKRELDSSTSSTNIDMDCSISSRGSVLDTSITPMIKAS